MQFYKLKNKIILSNFILSNQLVSSDKRIEYFEGKRKEISGGGGGKNFVKNFKRRRQNMIKSMQIPTSKNKN